MTKSTDIHNFLENIMNVNDNTMAGAQAGILGSYNASNDTVSNLKKTSVLFAQAYQNKESNQADRTHLSEQVMGYLQLLRTTNILSEATADQLMNQLEELANS